MLTHEEMSALDIITELYNLMVLDIIDSGKSREGDVREFTFHVHAIQNMILAQSAARVYPERFRLMGDIND